ncbi:MAG TPA: cutinase family protein [Mycobacterium sp.]|nr:cutinase family protein [Mycobacterium sp.]
MTWVLQSTAVPSTSAQPCPDVETVFARGTDEPPGLGSTGQAFVDSLHSKIGAKSLEVYPVNYPASNDWPTGLDGIRDASAHIQSVAAACPKTKMVLGGFSQGAAVMGFVTADAVPDGFDGPDIPRPMPPEMADHVAAVVLFGTPNGRAMDFLGQPQVVIGPLYAGKTIQLCAPEDPICSEGINFSAHNPDAYDGIVDQGAAYAANRV